MRVTASWKMKNVQHNDACAVCVGNFKWLSVIFHTLTQQNNDAEHHVPQITSMKMWKTQVKPIFEM